MPIRLLSIHFIILRADKRHASCRLLHIIIMLIFAFLILIDITFERCFFAA